MLYFTLVVVIALLAGIIFFMTSGRGQALRLSEGRVFIIRADSGEIRISENALENIIRIGMKELKGAKCSSIGISDYDANLDITVHCQIEERYEREQVVQAVQTKISDIIQKYSGIPVKEVKVLVQASDKKQLALKR